MQDRVFFCLSEANEGWCTWPGDAPDANEILQSLDHISKTSVIHRPKAEIEYIVGLLKFAFPSCEIIQVGVVCNK